MKGLIVTFQPTSMTLILGAYRGGSKLYCVSSSMQANVISGFLSLIFLLTLSQCRRDCRLSPFSPMPGEPVAIVLASDGSRAVADWQRHWFPCASCPDPDRAHSLLRCCYHARHRARREEKEGKAGGVLRARRGVFLCALSLDKRPISNPKSTTEEAVY